MSTERHDLPVFARRLKEARSAAKMSQRELADRAGLYLSAIFKLEQGVNHPSWDTVQLLARALGVPVASFVDPAIIPPEEPRKPGRPRIYPRSDDASSAEPPKRRKKK